MNVRFIAAMLALAFSGTLMAQITELDQKTLSQLQAAGSDLTKPHEVDHWLYFNDKESAQAAAKELEEKGFSEVSVAPSRSEWRVKAHNRFVPTSDAVASSTRLMESVAAQHSGEYDGWETQVVK